MDRIERDIYVCRGTAPDPIEYPQGTNAIPLIFYMRDFTMPDDAVVAFYMKKPSGAVIFNAGEYINDTITIPMTTQMSAESGRMLATVHILQEDRVLNTFNIPVFVQKVAYDPDAIESTDEMTALDYLLEHTEEIISGLSEEAKTLLQQYIEILKRYEADYQEEFEEWFENLKYVLDGDVAGHLQVEIEAVQESADTALEQLATGIVNGYLPQDDDCYTLLTFGDDCAIILPKKICSCGGSAQAEPGTTASQSQVDDAVEKYMETHEIQTTPVDATLTKSGEAADAKVVGDKLTELQEGSGSASTVSVKVGSTSTGDPGTDAEVSNSGTDQDVVLNFTIPRGDQGEQGIQGEAGPQGEAGADGFSPTVEVSKSGKVTTITITDQAGPHSAEILDGEDGTGGGEGGTGADGYSPTVSISKSDGVTTIVITDKNGDHTATINDGEQGLQGEKGDTGAAGKDGADGVSITSVEQTATSTESGGTNVVTVTLSNGTKSAFNITNGAKGDTGAAGSNGKDGSDGYTPVKGVDYFTADDIAEIVKQVVEQVTQIEVSGQMTSLIGF